MPYDIKQRNGKWAVVKKDGGKVMGTHTSRAAAERQRRALYANEGKRRQ